MRCNVCKIESLSIKGVLSERRYYVIIIIIGKIYCTYNLHQGAKIWHIGKDERENKKGLCCCSLPKWEFWEDQIAEKMRQDSEGFWRMGRWGGRALSESGKIKTGQWGGSRHGLWGKAGWSDSLRAAFMWGSGGIRAMDKILQICPHPFLKDSFLKWKCTW